MLQLIKLANNKYAIDDNLKIDVALLISLKFYCIYHIIANYLIH